VIVGIVAIFTWLGGPVRISRSAGRGGMLVDHLKSSTEALVLVSAPAGHGKITLLALCAAT
jgi:ATP/maltotriose-dependent transcriptional regulator MalT